MKDRIEILRNQIFSLEKMGVRYSLREKFIRESLSNTRYDSLSVRRAKAFKNILDNTEPIIFDNELIVGSILGIFPLYEHQYTEEEVYEEAKVHLQKKIKSGEKLTSGRTLMEHDYDYRGGRVSYELLRKVSQNLAKEMELNYSQVFAELQEYFSESPQVYYLLQKFLTSESVSEEFPYTFAHHVPVNYEKVLKRGYKDILKEAEEKFKKAEGEEKEFFHGVIISLEAVIDFIKRYGKKAFELAIAENNSERKKELEEIGNRCIRISENPVADFHEALQLVWFTHLILALAGGIALAFGRFDQYIYPYYKKDIEENKIEKEKAVELLSNFLLKCNEPKFGQVQNLTIGGLLPDGNDGTNEVSYLCLEAIKKAKVPYPNFSVRLHNNSSEDFYRKVVETIKFGRVPLSIFNDDIFIPALHKIGFALEDARDYCVMGCHEIMIPKKQPPWEFSPFFNFPKYLLELLLNKKDFLSFNELLETYKEHLSKEIERSVKRVNKKYMELYKIGKDPFASSLLDNCMEKGRDMYQRGTKYPASIGMWGLGIATLADSLASIKKLVYDEKRISLDEFVKILR
ncbi:MAG TPA: hypothetical protein ENG68_00010, partial [bacterium]|nr:hypothetical protein [bacterium]